MAGQPNPMQGAPVRNKALIFGLIKGTTILNNHLLRPYLSWGVPAPWGPRLTDDHDLKEVTSCSLYMRSKASILFFSVTKSVVDTFAIQQLDDRLVMKSRSLSHSLSLSLSIYIYR